MSANRRLATGAIPKESRCEMAAGAEEADGGGGGCNRTCWCSQSAQRMDSALLSMIAELKQAMATLLSSSSSCSHEFPASGMSKGPPADHQSAMHLIHELSSELELLKKSLHRDPACALPTDSVRCQAEKATLSQELGFLRQQIIELRQEVTAPPREVPSSQMAEPQWMHMMQCQLQSLLLSQNTCLQTMQQIQRDLQILKQNPPRTRDGPDHEPDLLQDQRRHNPVEDTPWNQSHNFHLGYNNPSGFGSTSFLEPTVGNGNLWTMFNLGSRPSSATLAPNAMVDERNTPANRDCAGAASEAAALNNQVLPGIRANNYWDNFKSFSHQNRLSTSSNTGGALVMDSSGRASPPIESQMTPEQLQNNAEARADATYSIRYQSLTSPLFSSLASPNRIRRKQNINREQNRNVASNAEPFGHSSSGAAASAISAHSRPLEVLDSPAGSFGRKERVQANKWAVPHRDGACPGMGFEHADPEQLEREIGSQNSNSLKQSIYNRLHEIVAQHEQRPDHLATIFQNLESLNSLPHAHLARRHLQGHPFTVVRHRWTWESEDESAPESDHQAFNSLGSMSKVNANKTMPLVQSESKTVASSTASTAAAAAATSSLFPELSPLRLSADPAAAAAAADVDLVSALATADSPLAAVDRDFWSNEDEAEDDRLVPKNLQRNVTLCLEENSVRKLSNVNEKPKNMTAYRQLLEAEAGRKCATPVVPFSMQGLRSSNLGRGHGQGDVKHLTTTTITTSSSSSSSSGSHAADPFHSGGESDAEKVSASSSHMANVTEDTAASRRSSDPNEQEEEGRRLTRFIDHVLLCDPSPSRTSGAGNVTASTTDDDEASTFSTRAN